MINNKKEITTNELKIIQLDILKEVHSFCTENNLRYSLSFGTLLGAVRHKGYIPWDDDIDIMMLRKDYEKFIKYFQGNYSKVISFSTDKSYYLPFAKVYDIRTEMQESVCKKTPFGVNIDVFPVDNMPNENAEIQKICRKKHLWNRILFYKNALFDKSQPFYKRAILSVLQFVLSVFSLEFVQNKLEYYSRLCENQDSSKAGIVAPVDNRAKWIVDSSIFQQYTILKFEGLDFCVVSQFDTYLKAIYGNYMKLPPEEQRVTHHSFVAYWK